MRMIEVWRVQLNNNIIVTINIMNKYKNKNISKLKVAPHLRRFSTIFTYLT